MTTIDMKMVNANEQLENVRLFLREQTDTPPGDDFQTETLNLLLAAILLELRRL
jgi:hypothetical protein